MKGAFVDTNVVLDLLMDRAGVDLAQQLMSLAGDGKLYLGFSLLSVANTAYVLRHKHGNADVYGIIQDLRSMLHILSMDEEQLLNALATPTRDFEDNLQYQCAKAHGFDTIITNNTKDFPLTDIRILTPQEALAENNLSHLLQN